MNGATVSDGPVKDIDFVTTKAYHLIKEFIYEIDGCLKTKEQMVCTDEKLEKIKGVVEETPLSSEHTRFANAAMRTVIEKVAEITDDAYLRQSFGNSIRMDFGTGHELNFLCYLFRRRERGEIKLNEVGSLIGAYARIIRFYVDKFHIEAAGARGCWSIDDYLLLPFVFGSSENFNSSIPIECITTGLFREAWEHKQCQGLLDRICKLGWMNINLGLLKMYDDEVLSKVVVTQHFIYSKDLPCEKFEGKEENSSE